jgi:hypothetical protein
VRASYIEFGPPPRLIGSQIHQVVKYAALTHSIGARGAPNSELELSDSTVRLHVEWPGRVIARSQRWPLRYALAWLQDPRERQAYRSEVAAVALESAVDVGLLRSLGPDQYWLPGLNRVFARECASAATNDPGVLPEASYGS